MYRERKREKERERYRERVNTQFWKSIAKVWATAWLAKVNGGRCTERGATWKPGVF